MKKIELRAEKLAAPEIPYIWERPKFRSGDIYAQSHGGWSSWNEFKVMLVRVFTLSSFSHVGVIELDHKDGHYYAIEAVRPESRRVLLSTIGPFYHLPMRAKWTHATAKYATSILGTPYSQWDAIRSYFRPLPDGTVSECAALAREVLRRAGVDLGPMSRPDKVVQRALELRSTITYICI